MDGDRASIACRSAAIREFTAGTPAAVVPDSAGNATTVAYVIGEAVLPVPEYPPAVAVPVRPYPVVAPRPVVWTDVMFTVPNDGWPNPPAPVVNAPVAPGRPKYIGFA
jgi:hypothetical protein